MFVGHVFFEEAHWDPTKREATMTRLSMITPAGAPADGIDPGQAGRRKAKKDPGLFAVRQDVDRAGLAYLCTSRPAG